MITRLTNAVRLFLLDDYDAHISQNGRVSGLEVTLFAFCTLRMGLTSGRRSVRTKSLHQQLVRHNLLKVNVVFDYNYM